MTSPDPRPGDIWLAYLSFSDLPEVGKVRPVVVVEADGGRLVAVAAKVTSKGSPSPGAVVVPVAGWEERGLRKPSYIRLDQRFEVPYRDLLRGAPIGRLDDRQFEEVSSAVREL